MPTIDIICPSGLRGKVRGLQGSELDLFANKKEIQKRRVSRQVLASCWVETTEAGDAYPNMDISTRIDFDKVLMCDRFYALLMIRVATHGSNYAFGYQCSSSTCRKKFEWEIDIHEHLDVYPLPEESIEKLVKDELFWTELGSDRVGFKLMYGADEDRAVKAQDLAPDMLATTSIIQRVKEVEPGDGSERLDNGNDLRRWAQGLGAGAAMDLVTAMDEVDGGVETEIEIQCEHCGLLEDVTLPLEEDFWSPRKPARSRKRKVRPKSQA